MFNRNKKKDTVYTNLEELVGDNEPLTSDEISKVSKTLLLDGAFAPISKVLARGKIYGLSMADMTGSEGKYVGTLVVVYEDTVMFSGVWPKSEVQSTAKAALNGNIAVTDLVGIPYKSYRGFINQGSYLILGLD